MEHDRKFVHAQVSLDILVQHKQPRKEPIFLNQLIPTTIQELKQK